MQRVRYGFLGIDCTGLCPRLVIYEVCGSSGSVLLAHPTCSPTPDLLHGLKCTALLSSPSGKGGQCACSGKFEL